MIIINNGDSMINYLSSQRKNYMRDETPEARASYWFEWMIDAAYQYELENWATAAAYCGCALETCLIGLEKGDDDLSIVANRLCLATIYLNNIQRQRARPEKARHCVATVCRFLQRCSANNQETQILNEIIMLLNTPEHHSTYFSFQLDFPINTDKCNLTDPCSRTHDQAYQSDKALRMKRSVTSSKISEEFRTENEYYLRYH